jgi:hypothetical protein
MFRATAGGVSFVLLTILVAAAQGKPDLLGGTIAEGYSSPDAQTPVRLAHRWFTATSRPCEELETLPTRLVPSPSEIMVRVGEEFLLPTLIVQATDSSQRVIPNAPISMTIWYQRGVLDFQDDQAQYFSITGVRPGNAIVIVQMLCGELEARIPIRIVQ